MDKRARALAHFLDALDAWGCEDNEKRAIEIVQFIDGGYDLSEYEDRTHLRVIEGGAVRADAADETRCRWPDCDCYSPQGPQACRRALPIQDKP